MVDIHQFLGVNFTEGVNPLTLAMAECGGNGTRVPWFFQWNTYGKNPGDDSFSDPKYAAISSPYSGMKNISELSSNECYFPNKDGGIDTAQCSDSQNMTWFGYATPNAPKKKSLIFDLATICNKMSMNQDLESYACQYIGGAYTIRAPADSNGRLGRNKRVKSIGIRHRKFTNMTLSFSILPYEISTQKTGIAELGIEKEAGISYGSLETKFFLLSFAANSTKLEFSVPIFKATFTTLPSLPLKESTKVKIIQKVTRTAVKKGSRTTTLEGVEIFFDDKPVKLTLTLQGNPNYWITLTLFIKVTLLPESSESVPELKRTPRIYYSLRRQCNLVHEYI